MAKLYFYYSAMNAGKTTTLLQSAHNYKERGMKVMLFSPSIDTRSGVGNIESRIGLSAEAHPVHAEMDLYSEIEAAHSNDGINCILLDEAQFLTKEQVHQLGRVTTTLGIPVLTYGLRTDFLGELFEGSRYLLGLADELVEIKTICECGKKATMNMRVDADGNKVTEGEQIEVGGNDRYIATCRRHFDEPLTAAL